MKSIILHLRIPFSLFLLPVYLFVLSQIPEWEVQDAWILGIIWHLFVYPSSNALNSYFDQDDGPIGGLANPPKATRTLYWIALGLDSLAVAWASWYWNVLAGLGILLYILVSRAYSSYPIRLKRYPILSWLIVGFFQGAFVFGLSAWILNPTEVAWFPALLSSGTLWAIYPITQVYQHDEDRQRGDLTLSYRLGIRGTFLFTAVVFGITSIGYLLYLPEPIRWNWLAFQSPIVLFFLFWMVRVFQDSRNANFELTMLFNALAALLLNAFYGYLILK